MGKQVRCIACKIDISVISNLLYLRNKIGECETNVNLSSKIFDHRDESNISRSEHEEIISHFALHSLQFTTMASEPSSATIASEPSTSTSEIQTDTPEPSQLEVLALNYLRNQEISTIPSRIPKLNPCSICQRVILKFRFQSFVVLDCEHLFHRLCLEKYIMQAETDPFTLTCPSCNVIIELTREEAVLASGKYHLQKKQTDTGQGDEDLMASLGLVEGGSRAGQGGQSKQVIMQDQATSPIMIEDDDDDDDDNRSNSVDNR